MPFSVSVSSADRIAHLHFGGVLTGLECLEAAETLWSHADWDARLAVVCDFRTVEKLRVGYDDLTGIVSLAWMQHAKQASGPLLLLATNRMVLIMARLYAGLLRRRRGGTITVCTRLEEVEAHLRHFHTAQVPDLPLPVALPSRRAGVAVPLDHA